MTDVASRLSPEEMAELAALADGSLPAERRAEVDARVAASPELKELLERQRQALLATQALEAEEVPASLRAAVETRRHEIAARRRRGRRFAPRLAVAGVAGIAAAVVAAIALTGGPGSPSVADAAQLATEPPNAAAPPPVRSGSTRLAQYVEGLAFPNLAQWAGWHAVGVRHGKVDGRRATVVFYVKKGKRLAYVIVAGSGLPRPSTGETTLSEGVAYQTLTLNGRLLVTWRRGGHTCVLIGQASPGELLRLASWQLNEPR